MQCEWGIRLCIWNFMQLMSIKKRYVIFCRNNTCMLKSYLTVLIALSFVLLKHMILSVQSCHESCISNLHLIKWLGALCQKLIKVDCTQISMLTNLELWWCAKDLKSSKVIECTVSAPAEYNKDWSIYSLRLNLTSHNIKCYMCMYLFVNM